MKSKRLILCLLGLCGWFVAVQAQTVALKTDLVNWATASLNLEPEVKVGRKSTMALGLSWNPWTFSDNKKWRHLRVQPEYRYWICRPFGGHFLGLHASYTRFNAGGVDLPFGLWPKLEDQRVQGNEWAVGLGYGYHSEPSLEPGGRVGVRLFFRRLRCLRVSQVWRQVGRAHHPPFRAHQVVRVFYLCV